MQLVFNQVNVVLAILVENHPRIVPMMFQWNDLGYWLRKSRLLKQKLTDG
jgi:hypothetical protein